MKEPEWAKQIAEDLDKALPKFCVEPAKRLIYANEVKEYKENGVSYEQNGYQTDILIYQKNRDGTWKPRVVIETKLTRITTHDVITYSQKSASHKNVHPYLRYGIFIGNRGHSPLPGRLFRHGVNFDFMLSWKGYEPKEKEWETLLSILRKEIKAAQKLEEMIFGSRNQQREKYFALHKPLVTRLIA